MNREHAPHALRALWAQQPGLRRGYVLDVAITIILGAATAAGGYARTQAAAWTTLNASGGPYLWGGLLVVAGVTLILASIFGPVALRWTLLAVAVVYGLFGWWFLAASLTTDASVWGAALCLYVAVVLVSRSEAYRAGLGDGG